MDATDRVRLERRALGNRLFAYLKGLTDEMINLRYIITNFEDSLQEFLSCLRTLKTQNVRPGQRILGSSSTDLYSEGSLEEEKENSLVHRNTWSFRVVLNLTSKSL